MSYHLFIEQRPFDGPSRRPSQRTTQVNAFSDGVALREANDFVDNLFEGVTELHELRAHLQRDDGTLVQEIVLTRPTPGALPQRRLRDGN
jgi:hypothetical protein